MRNDQNGTALHDFGHVLLNDVLTLVVECAGRLVKDQDPWIGYQRACNRNALTLSAGQAAPAFADYAVVSVR